MILNSSSTSTFVYSNSNWFSTSTLVCSNGARLLVRALVKRPGRARLNQLSNSTLEVHQTTYAILLIEMAIDQLPVAGKTSYTKIIVLLDVAVLTVIPTPPPSLSPSRFMKCKSFWHRPSFVASLISRRRSQKEEQMQTQTATSNSPDMVWWAACP